MKPHGLSRLAGRDEPRPGAELSDCAPPARHSSSPRSHLRNSSRVSPIAVLSREPPRSVPLVYALPAVREVGRALLAEGEIVEVQVAKAIAAGQATRLPMPGRKLGPDDRVVHSGRGWCALITRDGYTASGRSRWLILRLEREEVAA